MKNNHPSLAVFYLAALCLIFALTGPVRAATEVINNFGENDWYSWDTRDSSGATLNGTNDTSPAINSTLLGRAVGAPSTANDTAIEQQIIFMQEGQTVGDAGDAGNPPAISPSGSLNGLGYVRLDGTGSNNGKSDISYVNTSGIAASTALTDPSFGLSYRYYIDPENTFRTLGLNIGLTDSTQSNLYLFAYVDPAPVSPGGWETSSVSANSGLFRLIVNGTQEEGGATKTLADWQSDPTFGSVVFASDVEAFRIGFNVGSGQSNDLQYLDWMQTNLLNGGDVIDFQGVPETSTWLAASVLAAFLGFRFIRRRRIVPIAS